MRTIPRRPGTSDTFVVGDRVRKVEGLRDLGRRGIVTAISPALGGDRLVQITGNGPWVAYDRQLEKTQ